MDCDCQIVSDGFENRSIEYCPLHAAAPTNRLAKDRAIAWVRLLAQARRSPVTVTYNGDANGWLWTITNERGETLALQGDEFSAIAWMKHT